MQTALADIGIWRTLSRLTDTSHELGFLVRTPALSKGRSKSTYGLKVRGEGEDSIFVGNYYRKIGTRIKTKPTFQ